ncbi:hypothetical protein FQR65_LT21017 [Abscondita terminalis]|nr:hypothetical protein FQR65_LT21017 [Abscondita terminalis]
MSARSGAHYSGFQPLRWAGPEAAGVHRRGSSNRCYATARGTGPLLTVIVAVMLLGERPSPVALGGVAAIVAGVVAMGDHRPELAQPEECGAADRSSPALRSRNGVRSRSTRSGIAYALRELGASPVASWSMCVAL